MDTLSLISTWKSDAVGVSITGVLLQGSRFDGDRISVCNHNDPIFNAVPQFQIYWSEDKSSDMIRLPLYTRPDRERKIADVTVQAAEPDLCILAGSAFFLSSA
jgi:hypothetical protein